MNATDFFPEFAAAETKQAEDAAVARRRRQVEQQREHWRICWPEWDGPKVGGTCEVGQCIVHNLTHGGLRYHFCAPCKILTISEDGETFTVEIGYHADSPCARYNGEHLRLDITEVWAPVGELTARRKPIQPPTVTA